MIYSKSSEYAIQAMIYLAEKKTSNPIMISEIAKGYNIPQQFLAKIAQTLVKHRLLIAIRGRNGGVRLAKPPAEIYLHHIVWAIDGPPPDREQCVIGIDYCTDKAPCPLHHRWKVIREDNREMLETETLEELAERVLEKRDLMKKLGTESL
ncbi:MAG: Rrf2 family transcriptional regulator [Candidatus Marinimicrobia bacterium]|nr:Rrf2 family transcriptional regulator [Candidatus Neomarinimicrobiota bacterium]